MKKLLVIALSLALVLCLCACDSQDYKKAVSLMESKDYANALPMFETLADYKDSADMATRCRYNLAQNSMSDGAYAEALEMLETAGDYMDSDTLKQQCQYYLATEAMEREEYEAAAALFGALGVYRDSTALKADCEDAVTTQKVVGNWRSDEIDLTDMFRAFLDEGMDEETAEIMDSIDFKQLNMEMDLALNADGSYAITANMDHLKPQLTDLYSQLADKIVEMMEQEYTQLAQENGMTYEQLLAYFEVSTTEELVEVSLGQSAHSLMDETLEVVMEALTSFYDSLSGTFSVKNGTIYLATDGIPSADRCTYNAESDTLAFADPLEDSPFPISDFEMHRVS